MIIEATPAYTTAYFSVGAKWQNSFDEGPNFFMSCAWILLIHTSMIQKAQQAKTFRDRRDDIEHNTDKYAGDGRLLFRPLHC